MEQQDEDRKHDENKGDDSLRNLIINRVFPPASQTSNPPPMPPGLGWLGRILYLLFLGHVLREREYRGKILKEDLSIAKTLLGLVDVLNNGPAAVNKEPENVLQQRERHNIEMEKLRLQNELVTLQVQSRREGFKQMMKDLGDAA